MALAAASPLALRMFPCSFQQLSMLLRLRRRGAVCTTAAVRQHQRVRRHSHCSSEPGFSASWVGQRRARPAQPPGGLGLRSSAGGVRGSSSSISTSRSSLALRGLGSSSYSGSAAPSPTGASSSLLSFPHRAVVLDHQFRRPRVRRPRLERRQHDRWRCAQRWRGLGDFASSSDFSI